MRLFCAQTRRMRLFLFSFWWSRECYIPIMAMLRSKRTQLRRRLWKPRAAVAQPAYYCFRRLLMSSIAKVLTSLCEYFQHQPECTSWIRRSTGRLCVDLIPGDFLSYWIGPGDKISHPHGLQSLDTPNQEAVVIDSLTLEQYHEICYYDLKQIGPSQFAPC